jgi:Na+:H+ antiporter, NhaA family
MKTTDAETEASPDSSVLSGLLLIIVTIAALAISNSPLSTLYERTLDTVLEIRIGGSALLAKPLLLWINDGLMAVFFLFVGLEIKRELLEGNLSSVQRAALPFIAAFGGMLMPALIYASIAWGDAVALRGWAIPAATDIAFALGILALLGRGVPLALKVFLAAVAVIDDLGAIVIIALFYTEQLSESMLLAAGVGVALLAIANRVGIRNIGVYLLIGLALWFAVLKSGVHATLAGVVIAAFIPISRTSAGSASPLETLEHAIRPWVLFFIVPLFAFANAGVRLSGVTSAELTQPVTLGIALGLLAGKVMGVTGASWLAVKLRWAQLPPGIGWHAMLGVGLLCGVGFTMSLFIGTLAFEHAGAQYHRSVRIGVLAGSTLAAVAASIVLKLWLRRRA